jgi:large subunit ribosomal protein L10
MDRAQKEAAVAELTEDLKGAEAIFAVDYRGISVTGAADLRRSLAEADAVFKVVKNRLAKRAAEDAGTESLDELLVGPTALTLIHGDAVIAAKAISNFSRDHGVLVYKGGFMDGEDLDPDGFTAIARLPGLDVLHGQLVGLTASPLTGLVAGLSNMISGLGRQLAQIAEQGLVTGEPPAAEEPPAEEAEEAPPAEEAPADEPEAPADEPAAEAGEAPAAEAEAPESSEDESEADGEPSSDESEDTD